LFVFAFMSGFIATVYKCLMDPFYWSRTGEGPAWTVEEARQQGTLVTELDVRPREVLWAGSTARIREAWIEERTIEERPLIWFSQYKRLGGYYLCLNIVDGDPVPFEPSEKTGFVLGSTRSARLSLPRNVFFGRLKTPDEPTGIQAFFEALGMEKVPLQFSVKKKVR
jgi:hypothetical protein